MAAWIASRTWALATIAEKIGANTREVLKAAAAQGLSPRQAAHKLAVARVREAMALRRWHAKVDE